MADENVIGRAVIEVRSDPNEAIKDIEEFGQKVETTLERAAKAATSRQQAMALAQQAMASGFKDVETALASLDAETLTRIGSMAEEEDLTNSLTEAILSAATATDEQGRSVSLSNRQMVRAGEIVRTLASSNRNLQSTIIRLIGVGNQLGATFGLIGTAGAIALPVMAALAINFLRTRGEGEQTIPVIERLRMEMELLATTSAGVAATRIVAPEMELAIQKWMEARDRVEDYTEQVKEASAWTRAWAGDTARTTGNELQRQQNEALKEARTLLLENFNALKELGLPAEDLLAIFEKWPEPVRELLQEEHAIQAFLASTERAALSADDVIKMLNGDVTAMFSLSDVQQDELLEALTEVEDKTDDVRGMIALLDEEVANGNKTYEEAITLLRDFAKEILGITVSERLLAQLLPKTVAEQKRQADEADRAGEAFDNHTAAQRANYIATEILARGYNNLEDAMGDAAIQAMILGLKELTEIEAQLAGILDGLHKSTGFRGPSASSATPKTPMEKLLESFDKYGDRAPKAIKETRDELELFAEAARKAGDVHAQDLIASLLRMDPTASEVRSALSALQAQYGDLAGDQERAADAAKKHAKELEALATAAVRAVERMRAEAGRGVEDVGRALVAALRAEQDQILERQLGNIERLRDAEMDAHNDRLREVQRERDAKLGAIDAEIKALTQQRVDQRRADLLAEYQLKRYDPREAKRILDAIADLDRQASIDQLREVRDNIQTESRLKEEALKREYDAQMNAFRRQEEAARKNYSTMTETWRLESIARQMLMDGELDAIESLLEQYLPGWLGMFQSFSDSVIDGPIADIRKALAQALAQVGKGAAGGAASGVGLGINPNAAEIAMLDELGKKSKTQGVPEFVNEHNRQRVRDLGGIPSFATNAWVTAPTLAMVGDRTSARGEFVTGDDTLRKLIRDEMSRHGEVIELHNTTILDGRVIATEVRRLSANDLRNDSFERGYR